MAEQGQEAYEEILTEIRKSVFTNADETGWRKDGENGYIWSFSTPQQRYFIYRKSRSGQVAREVLNEEFERVTVSDFYGDYNALPGCKERCWVHFLRDLHKLREKSEKDVPQQVLSQRIERFLPELFIFVEYPEVPSENNAAERAVRPAVIARKISEGTRSRKGSETKMTLMSLFGTWAVQGLDTIEACRQMLISALMAADRAVP